MDERTLTLPWGKEELSLSLPDDWHLAGVLDPSTFPGVRGAMDHVRLGLMEPIGSPCLADLARAGMRVVLVIDDLSRPTPVGRILPGVLEELAQGGVRWEDITLVVALGLHRPMEEDEISERQPAMRDPFGGAPPLWGWSWARGGGGGGAGRGCAGRTTTVTIPSV